MVSGLKVLEQTHLVMASSKLVLKKYSRLNSSDSTRFEPLPSYLDLDHLATRLQLSVQKDLLRICQSRVFLASVALSSD